METAAKTMKECPTCGGSGFSGYGSGYDAVCGECGGQQFLPDDELCPMCGAYSSRHCGLLDEAGGICPWEEAAS